MAYLTDLLNSVSGSSIYSRLVIYGIFFYVFFYLILILSIDYIIFLPSIPSREITATPAQLSLQFEDVTIQTEDGETLKGWFIPAQGQFTVLFFHGNAGNISHRLGFVKRFHDMGLNTLIFDYRNYGASTGSATESGVYKDSTAVWQWLQQEKKIPAQQIILFGHSLGGAIAAELSTRVEAPLLIIESSFASVKSIGSTLFPYKLWAPFIPNKFPSTTCVEYSKAQKIIIAHDPLDPVIPSSESEFLLKAAGKKGIFLTIEGGGHNNVFSVDNYFQKIQTELDNLNP